MVALARGWKDPKGFKSPPPQTYRRAIQTLRLWGEGEELWGVKKKILGLEWKRPPHGGEGGGHEDWKRPLQARVWG